MEVNTNGGQEKAAVLPERRSRGVSFIVRQIAAFVAL
jgi:hypothetical protein